MNYKEFKDYIENMVPYETIYEDGEGRMILVITMLAAFTAMNRKWVGLTGTEINHIFAANAGYPERMMQEVANLLKEKNS
jgi:hypothetical protein